MGSSVVLSTNLNSRQFPVGRNCHGDVVVKFCQLVSILYRSVRCFYFFGVCSEINSVFNLHIRGIIFLVVPFVFTCLGSLNLLKMPNSVGCLPFFFLGRKLLASFEVFSSYTSHSLKLMGFLLKLQLWNDGS